jgi:hypothetical protein
MAQKQSYTTSAELDALVLQMYRAGLPYAEALRELKQFILTALRDANWNENQSCPRAANAPPPSPAPFETLTFGSNMWSDNETDVQTEDIIKQEVKRHSYSLNRSDRRLVVGCYRSGSPPF